MMRMGIDTRTAQRVHELIDNVVHDLEAQGPVADADVMHVMRKVLSEEQEVLAWLVGDSPEARAVRDTMTRRVYDRARASAPRHNDGVGIE